MNKREKEIRESDSLNPYEMQRDIKDLLILVDELKLINKNTLASIYKQKVKIDKLKNESENLIKKLNTADESIERLLNGCSAILSHEAFLMLKYLIRK